MAENARACKVAFAVIKRNSDIKILFAEGSWIHFTVVYSNQV